MGHCRYCGHRAGWFRSSHRQCAATYRQGLAQLVDLVAAASGRPDFTQRRMLRQFVQGAAIAESAAGLVPQRMNFPQGAPASALLRRSEQLVWLFDDVECCLGQLPPEPSPTITGVAAPGRDLPYYRPQSFVDRPAPDQGWESVARGQLAVASEHVHFRGPGLSIRLAYGSVLNWKPYHDGIGAVPRAHPNRLVVFRNGDGWFIYNLPRNLAAP